METNNHKGSELNNVRETWDQNERQRANNNSAGPESYSPDEVPPVTELDLIIRQEASEYDMKNCNS